MKFAFFINATSDMLLSPFLIPIHIPINREKVENFNKCN